MILWRILILSLCILSISACGQVTPELNLNLSLISAPFNPNSSVGPIELIPSGSGTFTASDNSVLESPGFAGDTEYVAADGSILSL